MKTKQQLALDKAYKEAGHNTYFGNGFNAGVEWGKSNQWIDVYDYLPEPEIKVLVHDGLNAVFARQNNGTFYFYEWSNIIDSVKYWMHIPETPES